MFPTHRIIGLSSFLWLSLPPIATNQRQPVLLLEIWEEQSQLHKNQFKRDNKTPMRW
jgi:hypothetical protein